MYTLYHSTGACSLAIKAALTLTQAQFNEKLISLSEGEHFTESYLALNPFGKVPALQVNDRVLTEGMALHLYLSERYPESGLLPQKIDERAEAYRWLAFLYSNVHPHFGRLFSPERYGNDVESVRSKAEASVFDLFAHIDRQLKQHDYIAGDTLTAADLYLVVCLHWKSVLNGNLINTYSSLEPYIQRIFKHPIVGRVFSQELN